MRTTSILALLCAVTLTACLIDTRKPAPAETISESCGNGILDPGEECDQGALNSDTGACLSSCRRATCGDGHTYPAFEQCDDGNRITEECEHGQESCTVCDARCQEVPGKTESCGNGILDPGEECDHGTQNSDTGACLSNCRRATCGDGHIFPTFEQCDDGNRVTEECEYGLRSCTVCAANCQNAPGETTFCGDGIIDEQEVCDDGNLSCGMCNSECQGQGWRRATGSIRAPRGSELDPDLPETFTLHDGINLPVTFEFDVEINPVCALQMSIMNLDNSNILIKVSNSCNNEDVAEAIAASINSASSLLITAETYSWYVDLTHSLPTDLGYQDIFENVATTTFQVNGMDGGVGRDCAYGESCSSDDDCETHWCLSGVCWGGG